VITKHQLKQLPERLHHSARIIRNQEGNRKLVEEILGIPLVATWIEQVPDYQDPSRKVTLCHTFYELGDGSALAFFEFENQEYWERVAPGLKERTGQYDHAALKVSDATFNELLERLKAASHPHRVLDHGYCRSLYVPSSEGYTLEFACDAANVKEINVWQRSTAHTTLERWASGDRTPNNNLRDVKYEQ